VIKLNNLIKFYKIIKSN